MTSSPLPGPCGATLLLLADLIEDDENPGLEGEALDAWNAATLRAAQLVRSVTAPAELPE